MVKILKIIVSIKNAVIIDAQISGFGLKYAKIPHIKIRDVKNITKFLF